MQKNLLEIGKVVNIHGLRGDVKIQPWCDSAGFLCEFDTLYRADGTPMSVASARAHKGMAVVRFAGIDTPEQAEALRNTVLYMNRADVELDADTYFIRDLIG